MGELSQSKRDVLMQLMHATPDSVLFTLESALMSARADPALVAVHNLFAKEAANRRVRDKVFMPIKPAFAPPSRGRLRFPPTLLHEIWNALVDYRPSETEAAADTLTRWNPEIPNAAPFDRLCKLAALAIRSPPTERFESLAAHPQVEDLTACLDLAPVLRVTVPQLREWVMRASDERKAAIRLAFKDAMRVSEDAGPRFFGLLDAHLSEPWLILRVISAAMDKPSETYLSCSELAPFATRAFEDIDVRLTKTREFDSKGGIKAGRATGDAILEAVQSLVEFEDAIELSREKPWGRGIGERRALLAQVVEDRLKEIIRAIDKALPMMTLRTGRKIVDIPKLDQDPDETAVAKVLALLAFADQIRPGCVRGGFGSTRTAALESAVVKIDEYIEELIALMKSEAAIDHARAHYFLEVAADFYALAKDEHSAQAIRRRVAVIA